MWIRHRMVVTRWKELLGYKEKIICRLLRVETAPCSQAGALTSTPTAGKADLKKDKHRWSAVLLFIPGIATFGLGTWQIKRHQWKVELLEHRRKRLAEEIVPLNIALSSVTAHQNSETPALNKEGTQDKLMQSLEYRRIQIKGVFNEDKSIFLGPRGRTNHGVTERGYFLITPMVSTSEDGKSVQVPVLVNRGWVPGSWRDAASKPKTEHTGTNTESNDQKQGGVGLKLWLWNKKQVSKPPKVETVNVVGVIRDSENPNMFVPSNDPASGQWFYIDVPAMAQAVGLPEDTIYVEALNEQGDFSKAKEFPLPKDPDAFIRSSVMPYDHLTYAATWYTLASATTFMAWKRLQKGASYGSRYAS